MTIIRPYTEQDFDGICALINAVCQEEPWTTVFPGGWSRDRVKQEFSPLDDYKDSRFMMAEDAGSIVGLTAVHALDAFTNNEITHLAGNFSNPENSYYLRDIIVHPRTWGGNLGFRLASMVAEQARQAQYGSIATRTHPANKRGIKFFTKLGYVQTFEDSNPDRVYFVKSLD